jgi:molybdenum cofactor synthesis domain-containing protein
MPAETADAAKTAETIVTAAVLVIGDEILSGRTRDANIHYIAGHFTRIGIRLKEVRVIGDDHQSIVAAVNDLRTRYSYLVTTGGIGPTHDDITADAVAAAFGVEIEINEEARSLLEDYFEKRGVARTEGRMRMARIPRGASLIRNAISVAPGFMIGNVIVLAGVPDIMQIMLDDVTSRLATGSKMQSVTISVSRPEGDVADLFATLQKTFPDVAMGSYPSFTGTGFNTQLVLRATNSAQLASACDALKQKLKERGLV